MAIELFAAQSGVNKHLGDWLGDTVQAGVITNNKNETVFNIESNYDDHTVTVRDADGKAVLTYTRDGDNVDIKKGEGFKDGMHVDQEGRFHGLYKDMEFTFEQPSEDSRMGWGIRVVRMNDYRNPTTSNCDQTNWPSGWISLDHAMEPYKSLAHCKS